MDLSQHEPDRSTWLCVVDGEFFPCRPARLAMIAEHGMEAASAVRPLLRQARKDLPEQFGGDMLRRISGWTTLDGVRRLLEHPPWCIGSQNATCRLDGEHVSEVQELPSKGGLDFGTTYVQLVAAVRGLDTYGQTFVRLSRHVGMQTADVALLPAADWLGPARRIDEWIGLEGLHQQLRTKHLAVAA